MSGYDRYAHDEGEDAGAASCPKCKRPGFVYDKVRRAWTCLFCRYSDR